uniref:Chemosensory protein 2 n=1 Tax=Sirex nitobei TaxID=1602346 RepID=A0A857N380_9HYME|nr:chemosensory protein 2 [Sirex nitobei]
MKSCLILFFLLVTTVMAIEKYSSRYDDVDVGRILANNRVLTAYIRCMLDEGSCTAEGRELKKTLPDALATGCSKCNEKQKVMAQKVIDHIQKKMPTDWNRLIVKYDPQGEYKKRYDTLQAAKNI